MGELSSVPQIVNVWNECKPTIKFDLIREQMATILGITEHLLHVFERFYRADSARARQTGGFGLGLAIASAIVQSHHGSISAASQPGYKTTFTVTLPVNGAS